MQKKLNPSSDAAALRRQAEARLKGSHPNPAQPRSEENTSRLFHELQVHQIELEMQNTELREARDQREALLERYTDLYDFAPMGYFSVDERGLILEANLTGAALLGLERSRLINQRFQNFVDPPGRVAFLAFFKKIFSDTGKKICEVALLNERSLPFWADIQARPANSLRSERKWCRFAVSDVTALKQAEEVRQSLERLGTANLALKQENIQRHKAEMELKKSEAHYARLFEQSQHMQGQLRHLSHQLLLAQEEERKRISRELHDEIVQTLVGINVHLTALTINAPVNLSELRKRIARTQRLVEKSVDIVHRFARELRPTVLDDLGLIPALQSFVKDFAQRTRIKTHFTAVAGVEELSNTERTVLYRVAQSALTNVHKHAKASVAEVSIRKLKNAIRLEIHDNGKSFEADKVLFAKRHKRLGLLGSRERVEMVGGKFGIDSSPGQGTTISAEIPITIAAPKDISKTTRKDGRVG